MSDKIDDGGLFYPGKRYQNVAFWIEGTEKPKPHFADVCYPGITCRDWLAGLAMQGILSNTDAIETLFEAVDGALDDSFAPLADASYEYADAMIAKSKEHLTGDEG